MPLTVTFVNSSTGVSTYVWDFGDETTLLITNALTSPITTTHTYTQAGVYTVTLMASNDIVTTTLTRPNYITAFISRDWRFITTTISPPVVGEHAMAYDSDRKRVILYGGNATGFPYETTTWELTGTTWITTTDQGPNARYGAQMAYDGTEIILFGGSDETDIALRETWKYTNTTWSEVQITGPLSRTYPSMVANPISGTIYLFGGNDGETYFNDLWKYENGTWTDITPATSPLSRTLAALAYDTTNNRLLLFGGRTLTGTLLADLWTYDPILETWSQLDDGGGGGGPPPRMAHTLTYDPDAGIAVLAGGTTDTGDTLLGDTWHYQNGWIQANPVTPLPPRAYHQAVYTPDGIVLFSDGEVWRYE